MKTTNMHRVNTLVWAIESIAYDARWAGLSPDAFDERITAYATFVRKALADGTPLPNYVSCELRTDENS